MAKRTYHDANGYKKKRRKRGTPEFATIAEYNEWIAKKKIAATESSPLKVFRGKRVPQDLALLQLERLSDEVAQNGSSPS